MPLKPEQKEQIKLFQWLRLHKDLKNCSFSIPNEAVRNKTIGALMKRMGLRPGASDIFIARPTHQYHGLFIELKAMNKNGVYGKASPAQLKFLQDMADNGYYATLCEGADNAINLVECYLMGMNVGKYNSL